MSQLGSYAHVHATAVGIGQAGAFKTAHKASAARTGRFITPGSIPSMPPGPIMLSRSMGRELRLLYAGFASSNYLRDRRLGGVDGRRHRQLPDRRELQASDRGPLPVCRHLQDATECRADQRGAGCDCAFTSRQIWASFNLRAAGLRGRFHDWRASARAAALNRPMGAIASYPGQLIQLPGFLGKCTGINQGHPGQTIAQIMAQFIRTQVYPYRPAMTRTATYAIVSAMGLTISTLLRRFGGANLRAAQDSMAADSGAWHEGLRDHHHEDGAGLL